MSAVDLSGRTAVPGTSPPAGLPRAPRDTRALAGRGRAARAAGAWTTSPRRQADRLAEAGYLDPAARPLQRRRRAPLPQGDVRRAQGAARPGLPGHRGGPDVAGRAARTAPVGWGSSGSAWAAGSRCWPRRAGSTRARSTTACCRTSRTRARGACPVVAQLRRQGPRAQGRRGRRLRVDPDLARRRARRQGVPDGQPLASSTTPRTGRSCCGRC